MVFTSCMEYHERYESKRLELYHNTLKLPLLEGKHYLRLMFLKRFFAKNIDYQSEVGQKFKLHCCKNYSLIDSICNRMCVKLALRSFEFHFEKKKCKLMCRGFQESSAHVAHNQLVPRLLSHRCKRVPSTGMDTDRRCLYEFYGPKYTDKINVGKLFAINFHNERIFLLKSS